MDAGIAAIAAAIISAVASILTAVVVAQITARSQSEIIQALARTTIDRDAGGLSELDPAKASISLRFLLETARFLTAFLRVLVFIAILSVGCYIGYRIVASLERDDIIHASPNTSASEGERSRENRATREDSAKADRDVPRHPDVVEPAAPNGTILPFWPVWLTLLSAGLAFFVSLWAKCRLKHISAPQSK